MRANSELGKERSEKAESRSEKDDDVLLLQDAAVGEDDRVGGKVGDTRFLDNVLQRCKAEWSVRVVVIRVVDLEKFGVSQKGFRESRGACDSPFWRAES